MIYTRWGSAVRIIRNCGQHKPKGFFQHVRLVLVAYLDNPSTTRYYFAETLKADDGIYEVFTQLSAAPAGNLGPETLAAALREAE